MTCGLPVIRKQMSVAVLVRRGVVSIENDWSAELAQLPANHGDRARWECVHAVGSSGNRDVLILSRSVAILHKSYRSDERMADVLVILDDETNRVGHIQIVVNQH